MVRASILFGLLIPFCSSGQPFRAFPDSNATWVMDYYLGPDFLYTYAYHLESFDHDTLINGELYSVLQRGFQNQSAIFAGGIRDDGSGRIYYYNPFADSTFLLYDLEAMPGDSMEVFVGDFDSPFTIMMHICSVETLTYAGYSYRTLYVQSEDPISGCIGQDRWGTRVGGYGGLLSTDAFSISGDATFLVCMSHNDTLWPSAVPGNCSTTGWPERLPTEYHAYPNPSNGLFTLSTASNLTDQVLVYDPHGREVLRTREKTIDLGAHPPGVYTAVVTTAQGRQAVRLVLLR